MIRILLWSFFYFGLLVDLHFRGGGLKQDFNFENMVYILTSWIAVLCFQVFISTFEKLKMRRLLSSLTAFLFAILFYYFKRVASPLGLPVLLINYDYLTSLAGWRQIGHLAEATFFASDFFWSAFLSAAIYFSYWVHKDTLMIHTKNPVKVRLICASTIIIISIAQPYTHDPFTNFIDSIYEHFLPSDNQLALAANSTDFRQKIKIQSNFNRKNKPNVFLIIVESFNARFVNKKSESNQEFTPYFNKLTKNNFYLENYFSNSVQTVIGHFAALCGQVPLLHGNSYQHPECLSEKCLPELLVENNYRTYFIQADPHYNYGNAKAFLTAHGIQEMPELFQLCQFEKERCYGLGMRDKVLYERTFNYLQKAARSAQPIFAVIATIASHQPFNALLPEERSVYQDPGSPKENYLNSLHMTDSDLKIFFDLLQASPFAENSIVIITGDHGFPTGEHGSYHNENFAYQENFGVPLLIVDPKLDLKNNFLKIQKNIFTHLNLGPTILDLAGLSIKTDFIADSVFSKAASENIAYLIQPYSGGFQSVIAWPYKYIFEEFKKREYLYDLDKDPSEQNNLFGADPELRDRLRGQATQIYKQQEILSCNKTKPIANLNDEVQ